METRSRSIVAFPLALIALTVLVSGHRFANDLVFDDEQVILDGTVIHDVGRYADIWTHHTMIASGSDAAGLQAVDTYRPATLTLFMMDAQLSGRSPLGYHLTNLFLHVSCVLLVWVLALAWLGRSQAGAALYGAAVFAVHPWSVEAHVWINGRSDPLSLLFGLAALLVLLRQETKEGRWMWSWLAAGVLALLGLLSKETLLLALPAIVLAPPPHGRAIPFRARFARRAPPLALAALAYLTLRALVLGGMRTHRDPTMLADAALRLPWLLLDAFRQALVPSLPYLRSLRDEYATLAPWQSALAAVVLIGIGVVAVRFRRREPLLAFSALWFFPPLLPVAIVSTVLWPGFGRYLYLPLAGLAWGLAALAMRMRERSGRPAARVAFGALHVVVLAVMAAIFTRDFVGSERLYGAAIAARPDIAMGHGWLGLSRMRRDDPAGALGPLTRAVELDPSTHRYLLHAGRAALAVGDSGLARALAARGIARFRNQAEEAPYHLLAVNAMDERDPERAVSHLVRCLDVWPGRPDCSEALTFLIGGAPDAEQNRATLERIMSARERPDG